MHLPSFDEPFLWAGILVYLQAREWFLLGEVCRSICGSESIATSQAVLKFVIYVLWSCSGRPSGTLTASPVLPLHNVGCLGLFCVKLKLTSGPGPRDSDHIPNRARNPSNSGTAFALLYLPSQGGFWGSWRTPFPAGQSPFDGITQANHRPAFLHPRSLKTSIISVGSTVWNLESSPPGENGTAVGRNTING
jgi:hypothetical protein